MIFNLFKPRIRECEMCGEIKICKKIVYEAYDGEVHDRCKECDDALDIKFKKMGEKDKDREKAEQLNWRKERDKLLQE